MESNTSQQHTNVPAPEHEGPRTGKRKPTSNKPRVRAWIWWTFIAGFLTFLAQYVESFASGLLIPSLALVLAAFLTGARALRIQMLNNGARKTDANLKSSCVVLSGMALCGALFLWEHAHPPAGLGAWQPPELPPKCRTIFVQTGELVTRPYDVAFLKSQPNQTVRQTNIFMSDVALTTDMATTEPSIAFTNLPSEVLEALGLTNADIANTGASITLTNSPQLLEALGFTNLPSPRKGDIPLTATIQTAMVLTNPSEERLRSLQLAPPLSATNIISITLKDNRLYLGVSVYSDAGDVALHGNTPEGDLPPNWDWNHSPKAVEIIDSLGHVVYRMFYKRPDLVRLEGCFAQKGSYVAVGGTIFAVGKCPPPATVFSNFTPVFKYPSWSHPGEYAK